MAAVRGSYIEVKENEIKTPAIDDKWFASIRAAIDGEVTRVSEAFSWQGMIGGSSIEEATALPWHPRTGESVRAGLGAAIEFRAPGTFKPVTGYRTGGPHGLDRGEWTDDTSMALALADSIAWWRQEEYSVNGTCFDIGTTTRSALVRFLEYEDAECSGLLSEDASGNGSIMRLAPVPIRYLDYFPDRIEDLADLAEESSMTTHASEQYRAVIVEGA